MIKIYYLSGHNPLVSCADNNGLVKIKKTKALHDGRTFLIAELFLLWQKIQLFYFTLLIF
jgi:hypothetical protein